ncbi:MAG: non-canonical purine NTP diphosphatase [Bacteroidia bacterium]|nr:non-canonical purine NTP diphosphatase [Bacteroidia bacterium]NNM23861.1 non-canonical purine NTP diphosphatase [Flavobacteriaceae bacterium]
MKLVFATHNQHKFTEVHALMPPHIELVSLAQIGCFDDIPETESTIEGNAVLKAQFIKNKYGLDCFADDTGLEVAALDGAPGVYSARYAGQGGNSEANIRKLLENLHGLENRSAQFKTVIALSLEEDLHLFTGICQGNITQQPRGDGGFGYDPVFQAKGSHKTFAEITSEEKGRIGHRGKAIRALVEYLFELHD